MTDNKVFIFGIDGATWDVLNPLIQNGSMPNLRRLIEDGIKGTLHSSIPPDTATAWTTFQTGVNPGKHGIFAFNQYTPGTYRPTFINSEKILLDTIWQVISQNDRRVIILNVPVTYPPYRVNGSMVTGLLTPSLKSHFTYPEELAHDILDFEADYTIITTQQVFNRTSLQNFVDKLIYTEHKRTRVMRFLLAKKEWDVAMIHFQSTDPLQHAVYCYLDQTHPLYDQKKHNLVTKLYRSIDDNIGQLMEDLLPETLKIILSDHGFTSVHKTIHLNNFLINQGLMALRDKGIRSKKFLPILKLLRAIDQRLVRGLFSFAKVANIRAKVKLDEFIDWENTKASMLSGWLYGMIHLNCQGRDPEGIVSMGNEYEELRDMIKQKLLSLRDPETQTSPIKEVWKREELYDGDSMEHAPDLIVIPEDGYEFSRSFITGSKDIIKKNVLKKDHTCTHTRQGIFVFSGNNISGENPLNEANIVDLFPTILYSLGIPIPDYTDGKVLSELFTESFRNSHSIRYETHKDREKRKREKEAYSEKDANTIEQRLKDLGYM
ncbi:MAG: hypothetical protein GQ544_07065 [Candidatus Aminicenantes bacterium]|nr:hypothetical protein [Candidatus Aminicenantes bacterium]